MLHYFLLCLPANIDAIAVNLTADVILYDTSLQE